MLNIIHPVEPRALGNQSVIQRGANRIGKFIPNSISSKFEMNRVGALGRWSLLAIGFIFVLGARWYKSRDAHERREVLTRDGITVGAAMLAVPIIKNWMQRGIDKLSKIPTSTETNKIFSTGDFGFDNLKNWYSKAKLMPEKVLTMAKNIVSRKGDLKKAFSTLGDEGMNHVKVMLQGKEATSENILKALENAFTSTDANIKGAFEGLTNILSSDKNGLVQSAQRLKAIPSIASLVFVTALLGWGIPAFNIRFTRKKVKQQHMHENFDAQTVAKLEPAINNQQQNVVDSFFAQASKK
ncbi:MAG: hypothetical protein MJ180_05990 [Candidatus Gastranaerophilales bacterium]|nr:hypothetical protein [Candidatus Gastranaerophilales bacterium]